MSPESATGQDASKELLEVQTGRRAYRRLRLAIPSMLTSVFGSQRVMLSDLSQGGMKVHWQEPVKPGSDVVIALQQYELFGHVAWATPHLGGLAMEMPLAESFVLSFRDAADFISTPLSSRALEAASWSLENLRYNKGKRWNE